MLMGLLRNVPAVIRLDGNGSRDRNRRIVRTGRTYGQKQGRISKMFDANGLDHYLGYQSSPLQGEERCRHLNWLEPARSSGLYLKT